MNAVAISNNDMVYLHWHVEEKIPNCLGFTVIRHDDKKRTATPLPAMVGFKSSKPAGKKFSNTNAWPIQKYAWKDLFAQRGGTYWYEVIPMIGTPDKLTPDTSKAMRTNSVTLDSKHGDCSVYFNRGIISTQAIANALSKTKSGVPNTAELKKEIAKANSPLRARLVGDLENGVVELLERARTEGGQCYCALYELSDKDLIDHLKQLKKKVHIVLSNAGENTEEGAGDGDSTNKDGRAELHALKMDVTNRMLKKGHIGHNKFVIYADTKGPLAVLSGSTNWTPTGLCAQSNNAIVVESRELAKDYMDYWKMLKADTLAANGNGTELQAKDFRSKNKKERSDHPLQDPENHAKGEVRVWFSPNTPQKTVPRPKKDSNGSKTPPTPVDLQEVFSLIEGAKQGVLFLAFIPGNPSIVSKLKEVYDQRRKEKKLFYLRGAATSPDPAGIFRVDLYHRSSASDATVRGMEEVPGAARASASVSSVAGIFATFAQWEAEIYKVGHAVIHDKILVIDPFTDDSVVITGSHNLGFRASYANDENMLVIRDDRSVAAAYAAHVLDVYEHYRWRWKLQEPLRDEFQRLKAKKPKAKAADLWKEATENVGQTVLKKAWQHLCPDDTWQDFYVENKNFLAAETNFWSEFSGVAVSNGTPRDPVR